jgi:MYXO-CTERM domain-containing protein
MKPLMFAAVTLLSTPVLAESTTAAQYSDSFGVTGLLVLGAVFLLLARRRAA